MTIALIILIPSLATLYFFIGLWWGSRAVDRAYVQGIRRGYQELMDALTRDEGKYTTVEPGQGYKATFRYVSGSEGPPADEVAAARRRRERAKWN